MYSTNSDSIPASLFREWVNVNGSALADATTYPPWYEGQPPLAVPCTPCTQATVHAETQLAVSAADEPWCVLLEELVDLVRRAKECRSVCEELSTRLRMVQRHVANLSTDMDALGKRAQRLLSLQKRFVYPQRNA